MSSVNLLWAIAAAVGGAYVMGVALVHVAHRWGHFMMDHPGTVQKFHVQPVPRVGGLALLVACTAAWSLVPEGDARRILGTVLVAGLLALGIGLAEDLTKRVGVLPRLLITISSGIVASLWTGLALNRTGVPMADTLLAFWPLAVLFTGFAAGGIANAINIIDGFNGLASGTVTWSLLALSAIAFHAGDQALSIAALLVAAAMVGFMVVNFPWGRLFLGDGGAYFAGFALAWLCVELLARNPRVSPWAAVLLCAYPSIEVLYSILRRRRQRLSPGAPDRAHLHSLVATRLVQPRLARLHPSLCNSAVSIVMWGGALLPLVPAVAFYRQPSVLLPCLIGFVLLYHFAYRRLWLAPEAAELKTHPA
ncbi:glycosyltransferase [Ramlibacter sp.]|uniref:MraY family glycosyltransferase n=1 Tax=Ramlibacter sp. TaxID=1917967 RepID=UPI0035ADAE65